MTLTEPLLTLLSREISARDLILIGGGLFLLWKSVHEIHNALDPHACEKARTRAFAQAYSGRTAVRKSKRA